MTESETVCWCDLCGEDLCVGSLCYRLEGLRLCPDCLASYARTVFRSALETVQ